METEPQTPRMQRSALGWAIRPFAFGHGVVDQGPAERRTKLIAGVLGIVLGVPIFLAGYLLGSVVGSALLRWFFGPSFSGPVRVPNGIIAVVYAGALWGGLMVLGGSLRIIQVAVPRYSTPVAIVVLPIVAIAILIALMAAFLGGN